jgi:hypothetical protein
MKTKLGTSCFLGLAEVCATAYRERNGRDKHGRIARSAVAKDEFKRGHPFRCSGILL